MGLPINGAEYIAVLSTAVNYKLTQWPLGDLDAILKLQFSTFFGLVSSDLLMIMHPDECHGTSQSILVHVMVWCRQATSHHLNQCWPRSPTSYGVNRPQCHCGETVTIIAVTIIQDGGRRRRWVRAGSIVTLVRNAELSYPYTIQGRHRSWFCVSCFVGLCICFWNMGLWNLRDMIVTYKPDIGDMVVTVHGVWS